MRWVTIGCTGAAVVSFFAMDNLSPPPGDPYRYPTEILHGELPQMNLLRIFGFGQLPPEADQLMHPDTRIMSCENLSCTVTLRNFRSPQRACNWKRQWFAGSIAVSDNRLIAFRWRKRLINTNFDDPRFAGLSITADNTAITISHDASLYRNDWSGNVEYRFRTPEADRIAETIRAFVPQPVTMPT